MKEEFKQFIKEEEARHNDSYIHIQEQLYEQARRNSMHQKSDGSDSESKSNNNNFNFNQSGFPEEDKKNQEYQSKVI
jgi:hypothetical protein